MRNLTCALAFLSFSILFNKTFAQTNKNIQGTWRLVSSTISGSDWSFKMDSSTHNMTKTITSGRVVFTLYNKKTDSLEITGQGKATTKGNQYIETFEQSNDKDLLKERLVYTYKVKGNKLSYEGGTKDFHIVEVLKRIE
jgi:hypothetical protein